LKVVDFRSWRIKKGIISGSQREKAFGHAFQGVDRRRFLKLGLLVTLPFISSGLHLPRAFTYGGQKRILSFYNTHTGEALSTLYWESGEYLKPSLSDINHILRDHRTDEVMPMDLRLLDLLHAIHLKVGTQEPSTSFPDTAAPERMPFSANRIEVWSRTAFTCTAGRRHPLARI